MFMVNEMSEVINKTEIFSKEISYIKSDRYKKRDNTHAGMANESAGRF